MRIWLKTRQWWSYHVQDVGKTVYWNCRQDPSFTGEYIITTKRNERGYIGIWNEKKGHRVVPNFYVELVDESKRNSDLTKERLKCKKA